MSEIIAKRDSVNLINELLNDIEKIDFLIDQAAISEREELELVMRDQIYRLHSTLDEIERVLKHETKNKSPKKEAINFSQTIYST